jgi:hypothetical protein
MFRKMLLLILIVSGYIYLVSFDSDGAFFIRAKSFYKNCITKYNEMNLQYHVNKWPKTK